MESSLENRPGATRRCVVLRASSVADRHNDSSRVLIDVPLIVRPLVICPLVVCPLVIHLRRQKGEPQGEPDAHCASGT
jgi:hypothetical protein